MTGWLAKLAGDSWQLEQLGELLDSSHLRVVKEYDGYYLRAAAFDGLTEAAAVHAEAQKLLPHINGAMRLHFGHITPIMTNTVAFVDEQGQRLSTTVLGLVMTAGAGAVGIGRITVIGPDGVPLPPPPSDIQRWTSLAAYDDAAAHTLRLLSYEPDWSTLHKLLEVVEQDVGGEKELERKPWAHKAELKRFTHTANSYIALGDETRHAHHSKWEKPPNPMTFSEAELLIRQTVTAWLNGK
jgi:hypothetical protein